MADINEIRWPILWRVIAGDIPIPDENSFVFYRPRIHAATSDQPLLADAHINDEQQELLCLVTSYQLLTSQPPDSRIFVRFFLHRARLEDLQQFGRGDNVAQLDPSQLFDPYEVHWKHITQYEATTSGVLNVPVGLAQAMPDHFNGNAIEFMFMQEEVLVDLGCLHNHGQRRLSRGWRAFRQANNLRQDDDLVFVNMDGQLSVGVRRFDRPPAVQLDQIVANVERYLDPNQDMNGVNNIFTVDYYPHDGIEPYVVLYPN